MGIFYLLFVALASLTAWVLHIVFVSQSRGEEIIGLALDDARNQVYFSYLSTNQFPERVYIDFYPFYSYSTSADSATLWLYGLDKKKNTSDDIKVVWWDKEFLGFRYIEYRERARIIAQTAYALCQRRLAKNEYPIWAPNLDTLTQWSDLPDFYTYTPFGERYIYDVSSCKEDYCYCTKPIVRAP